MWFRGRLKRGRPSATAQRVAAHRLTFERVEAPYGDPGPDLELARDVAAGVTPSSGRMHEYLRARTAFFDRAVVGALQQGMAQVVIGAAGYDGRAFRYAKPGVTWFELDHPSTQADKMARLGKLGVQAGHVRFVAADFASDPVAQRLREAGLEPGMPSLFLLEGVAVYLEPRVLERVLRQLREVAASGSRLMISVSTISQDPVARARFQAAVASMGEPVRSTMDADEAGTLLASTGWELVAGDGPDPEAGDSPARVGSTGADGRRERLWRAGFLVATPTGGRAVGVASIPAR
jgi:methyltransferase (TIGR00027 family)